MTILFYYIDIDIGISLSSFNSCINLSFDIFLLLSYLLLLPKILLY
jgi:hypothetical protein